MTAKSSAAVDAPAPEIVSTAVFAERIDATPSHVRKLQRDRVLPKKGRDAIPLVEGLVAMVAFLRDEERRSSKAASASRVQDARAREIELRVAREEGKLVDFADAKAAFSDTIATFRVELDGVPAAASRDRAARAAVKATIDAALARCERRFRERAAALRAGADPLSIPEGKTP